MSFVAGVRHESNTRFWILLAALFAVAPAFAADHVFLDGFETPVFAGTNLSGMEMDYSGFTTARGPVAGTN